jgi:hypothetical protein
LPTVSLLSNGGTNLLSEADRKWAEGHLDDVRVIDTDHFIIFRHPEVVAELVLEASSHRFDVLDCAVTAK